MLFQAATPWLDNGDPIIINNAFFPLAPVQTSQSQILFRAGRLKETVFTPTPSTVPCPGQLHHSPVHLIWSQLKGFALSFRSLCFCWDKGLQTTIISYSGSLIGLGQAGLDRAWVQATLQGLLEPSWVSRMLLGESGCCRTRGGRK